MKTWIIMAVLMTPVAAHAHPESGFLPDAVAEMEYKIVLDINPSDVATRNKLGVVLYNKNRPKEAAQEFMEALKISPKNFDAHDGMGLVATKGKKYNEAVSWFRKAIGISSEDTMAHYHLGFALEQAGELSDAERSYKKALEVNERLIKKGVDREAEKAKRDILLAALKAVQQRKKTKAGVQ